MLRSSMPMQEPAPQLFIRDGATLAKIFAAYWLPQHSSTEPREIFMQQFTRNITAPTRLLSIFCGLALATAALAAEPHYGNPVFTADADSKLAREDFATDTPKIYLHVQLEDVAQNTKLSAAWIAEKTDAAPANYKIDSAELTATEGMNEATFSLSKPTAGWPAGNYRVDLSINGKIAASGNFTVSK
jgi:hypothetical protein